MNRIFNVEGKTYIYIYIYHIYIYIYIYIYKRIHLPCLFDCFCFPSP